MRKNCGLQPPAPAIPASNPLSGLHANQLGSHIYDSPISASIVCGRFGSSASAQQSVSPSAGALETPPECTKQVIVAYVHEPYDSPTTRIVSASTRVPCLFTTLERRVERAPPKRCCGLTAYGSNKLNEHGRDPPVAADVSTTYSFWPGLQRRHRSTQWSPDSHDRDGFESQPNRICHRMPEGVNLHNRKDSNLTACANIITSTIPLRCPPFVRRNQTVS